MRVGVTYLLGLLFVLPSACVSGASSSRQPTENHKSESEPRGAATPSTRELQSVIADAGSQARRVLTRSELEHLLVGRSLENDYSRPGTVTTRRIETFRAGGEYVVQGHYNYRSRGTYEILDNSVCVTTIDTPRRCFIISVDRSGAYYRESIVRTDYTPDPIIVY
jgi:hypothetical protein